GHTNLDNVSIAGVVTATTFVGAVTGNVTGNATGLSGNPSINITDLDVDGHTNLDNVSIAGVTTFTGVINGSQLSLSGTSGIRANSLNLLNAAGSASYAVFTNGGSALLKHNNTDRLETSASGVTVTGTVAATSYTGDGSQLTGITAGITTISGTVSVANDLDVDGHTNLDNVNIAGVTTFATTVHLNTSSDSGASRLLNIAHATASSPLVRIANTHASGRKAQIEYHNTQSTFTQGIQQGSPHAFQTFSINPRPISFWNSSLERLRIESSGNVSIFYDLDVDGHTNLDNVSIAGVVTATTFVGDGSGLTGITASGSGVVIKHDGSTVGTAGTI
ncbi:MAG: hypothetical protein VXY93_12575, partial [Pseudomonadota bacterium]|nr:hypothetical protein [Pseudomonadota bacterium]